MAFSENNLGNGQIASTTVISAYLVPSSRSATVYSAILTNTTASIIAVSVYFDSGTSRLLEVIKIPGNSWVSVDSVQGMTMSSGNSLKLQAATASAFNYKINGSERT